MANDYTNKLGLFVDDRREATLSGRFDLENGLSFYASFVGTPYHPSVFGSLVLTEYTKEGDTTKYGDTYGIMLMRSTKEDSKSVAYGRLTADSARFKVSVYRPDDDSGKLKLKITFMPDVPKEPDNPSPTNKTKDFF